MDRRNFFKMMGAAGLAAMMPLGIRKSHAAPYTGPFFISIAAEGAWDVTSFCDPKMNVGGEPVINHWAQTGETQTVSSSSIQYAPFGRNQEFFTKYRDHMLVINGIDAQTNAHDAGIRHCWSGRLLPGYPSLAALAATVYGADQPLAFLSNGGYKETAGLVPYTLMQDPSTLRDLVNTNAVPWGEGTFHYQSDLDIIEQAKQDRLTRLRAQNNLLPAHSQNMQDLFNARANISQLDALQQNLPTELVSPIDRDGHWNPLLQQAQIALAAYASGLTVSADLIIYGFDTHVDHDTEHEQDLTRLVNGLDYLWDTAEALGIAEQLVVFVTSDFGRTPAYNDDNGKDHWPIGSALFMQKNASWANRVVGQTDGGHNALAINPTTLQVDSGGTLIYPMHVQEAFRELAGIAQHEVCTQFPLTSETIDFFNPSLATS